MSEREIVAVITGDTPPVAGMSPNGAGIRAWGMAEALRLLGHDAALLFPTECLAGKPLEGEPFVAAMPRAEIAEAPKRWAEGEPLIDSTGQARRVKALVYQHWGIMSEAAPSSLPKAVDLAGPHLLERHYWRSHHRELSRAEKLTALAQADFAVIGSRWQAAWMAPFLGAAWGDEKAVLDELELLSFDEPASRLGFADFFLPASIARVAPQPYRDAERPVIAYAGAFLPWQNPVWAIRETLAFLDEIDRGDLLLLGSPLPGVPMEGDFAELLATLDLHPRVRRLGRAPLDWVGRRTWRGGRRARPDGAEPGAGAGVAGAGVPVPSAWRPRDPKRLRRTARSLHGRREWRGLVDRLARFAVAARGAGGDCRRRSRSQSPSRRTRGPPVRAHAGRQGLRGGVGAVVGKGGASTGRRCSLLLPAVDRADTARERGADFDQDDLEHLAHRRMEGAAAELRARRARPTVSTEDVLPQANAHRIARDAVAILELPGPTRDTIRDAIEMLYAEEKPDPSEASAANRTRRTGGQSRSNLRRIAAFLLSPLAAWWAKRAVLSLGNDAVAVSARQSPEGD
jgi:hypothetical protein